MDGRETDEAVAALAARQHGVVSRAQLRAAGVSAEAIRHRLARGRLRRLHQGVYAVGPVEAPLAREMAAVLASHRGGAAREDPDGARAMTTVLLEQRLRPVITGPEQRLRPVITGPEHPTRAASPAVGHRSAAVLWRLLGRRSRSAPVDIVAGSGRRSRPGIRVHRVRGLHPDELTLLDGLPITTPARTVLDLAGSAREREVGRALQEGMALGLVSLDAVRSLLERHPKHPGAAALRALLEHGDPVVLRSRLEKRTRALLRRAGLGPIQTNMKLLGFEVDTYLPAHKLVVEADAFATHGSPDAFETDRDRDGVLVAAGYRVRRVTWRQVTREPEKLLVQIGMMLRPEDEPGRE